MSRRILLGTLPHMFACREQNFNRVDRGWQYNLVVAKQKQKRADAVVAYYETLTDDVSSKRNFHLKQHMLEFKETVSDTPDAFEAIWDQMNRDYEINTLLRGCVEL